MHRHRRAAAQTDADQRRSRAILPFPSSHFASFVVRDSFYQRMHIFIVALDLCINSSDGSS